MKFLCLALVLVGGTILVMAGIAAFRTVFLDQYRSGRVESVEPPADTRDAGVGVPAFLNLKILDDPTLPVIRHAIMGGGKNLTGQIWKVRLLNTPEGKDFVRVDYNTAIFNEVAHLLVFLGFGGLLIAFSVFLRLKFI